MKQTLSPKSQFFYLFLILITITIAIIPSGCLQEYGDIHITNVDVMAIPDDGVNKLTVTTYIQNSQDSDSGVLSVKIKVRDPATNLIVVEKDSDIGYIKSTASASNTMSLLVSGTGEFLVEVNLFEGGKSLTNYIYPITVKAQPIPDALATIKLTNMNLIIKEFVNDASKAVVDISPGIYNQGGDSRPLTMEVTARVNPYTAYTESDELGIIKKSNSVRGNMQFILPKTNGYTFTVSIREGGKTVVIGNVGQVIKLNEIKKNTLMTYPLVEEGVPVTEAATPVMESASGEEGAKKQPGFQIVFALIGILLVYNIVQRRKNKEKR